MLRTDLWLLLLTFLCSPFMLSGCGGGGGGGSTATHASTTTTVLEWSPQSYDFGYVTQNNSPAAKTITLSNNRQIPVEILNMELTGEFNLDLVTGTDSCGVLPVTLPAGGSCSLVIGFTPAMVADYSGLLTITTDDADSPLIRIAIAGSGITLDIENPQLNINQVEPDSCPASELTVYVSVTDPLGFSVPGLTLANFSLAEGDPPLAAPLKTLDFVRNVNAPIAVVLVMDYSSSITSVPEVVAGMEAGVISFIDQLDATDQAEILKFSSRVEVVQPFTAGDTEGKTALTAKVLESWDNGIYTHLYDALYQAVDEAAASTMQRRAVIVLSDGVDKSGDVPIAGYSLQDVISHADASGVPIFTVRIGDISGNGYPTLTQLSADSGGQYFDAPSADNLGTIYQQQAELLFVNQYVLTYDSLLSAGGAFLLTVGVQLDGASGHTYVSRTITPCP